jgi:hypothetical protein
VRPGGTVILETVNPHSLEAFKTFYTDLTHQRPIFPEVALALIELAGFTRAHVVFPLGTGPLIENRQTQGDTRSSRRSKATTDPCVWLTSFF